MEKYKITHKFSDDPTSPTFEETIIKARCIFLSDYLSRLTPEHAEYVISELKKEGYIQ